MPRLTPRDLDIVRALAAGGPRNKEIAYQLGLSPDTVKVYISRILQKLGVGSRLEIILWAYKNGVAEMPKVK